MSENPIVAIPSDLTPIRPDQDEIDEVSVEPVVEGTNLAETVLELLTDPNLPDLI